jgi:hypothetical protein
MCRASGFLMTQFGPSMSAKSPKPLQIPDPDPNAEALAALEKRLQRQLDGRKEERFCWIVVVVALFDVVLLRGTENAVAAGVVATLEILLLFVLARRLGVNDVVQLLDRLLHQVTKVEKEEDR